MTQDEIDQFCAAAAAGDLEKVKQFLATGANPNAVDSKRFRPPLLWSGANGHEAVFFELVKAGADVHARHPSSESILVEIAGKKGALRMVQAVAADGLRPIDDASAALQSASYGGDLGVVQLLIKSGADANYKHRYYGSTLLAAVMGNRADNVAELLRAGAKTSIRVPSTPFHDKAVVKKTALELAIHEGFTEVVAALEAAGVKLPKTPVKPPRPAAAGPVADSWKRIKKWLKANAPEWKAALKKAAKEPQLEKAEAKLGFKLPDALRETYLLHNGSGDIFPNPDDIAFFLLPVDEAVDAWIMQKELLESGDFDGQATSAAGIRKEWWNTQWLPFASNGGGDFFCIDLAPADGGTVGQVITSNHETGEHKLLASSLREWLHHLSYDLEDGKYSYDGDSALS